MILSKMTVKEKGYKCPNLEDCSQCDFYRTLCIVFGKEGKKNYKKWLSSHQKVKKGIAK